MEKRLTLQFMVFWLAIAFLPKNIAQLVYILEMAIFIVYWLYRRKQLNRLCSLIPQGGSFVSLTKGFFIVASLYLCWSYVDLPSLWNVPYLLFSTSFIYRHFIVITEIAMTMGLGLCIYKTEYIFNINKYVLLILTGISIGTYLLGGGIAQIGLVVSFISLLTIRFSTKLPLLLVPFVFTAQSAYFIAAAMLIFVMICQDSMIRIFVGRTKGKLFGVLAAFVFVIIANASVVMEAIMNDPNSIWRLMVWTNEIESLSHTLFTGVGFGTAYVTTTIGRLTDNTNMYFGVDTTGWDGLFLIANHNTFLNMFYRMGIVGGVLFLLINVSLVAWSVKNYISSDKLMRQYIRWGLGNFLYQVIIILLNPGLEMMQFAINYIFSFAILLVVLLKTNNLRIIKTNNLIKREQRKLAYSAECKNGRMKFKH